MTNFIFKNFWIIMCVFITSFSIFWSINHVRYNTQIQGLENIIEANDTLEQALKIKLEYQKKLNNLGKMQTLINEQMKDFEIIKEFTEKHADGRNNNELVCPSCNRKI